MRDSNAGPAIDPVTLEILWTRMISVVDEAAATFVRTSFSTLVRDANDFAVVLTDKHGRSIAQSSRSIPSFISTMPLTITEFIKEFGTGSMGDDDAYLTNDPWLGTGHLNDASMAMPILRNGELIGFAGVVSHLPDVGGRLRNPANKEIYEEGIRIPPMRFLKGGEPDESIVRMIRANVRVPDETLGDIWAQVSCCRVLAAELNTLLDETGVDINVFAEEVIGRTERAMRDAIRALPDGSYQYVVENDGPGDFPGGVVRIDCTVTIDGDELHVDYEGSSPQVDVAVNVVPTYTFAYTAYALKTVLAPWIPNAQGSFIPITVTAPEGSLLNPTFPAPTGSRAMMGHLLPPAVYGALAEVMPDDVQASPGSPLCAVQLASRGSEDRFVVNAFIAAGQGASASQDGPSAVSFPSNLSNAPIEVIENLGPVEVLDRSIRRGSGGDGARRGGDGIAFRFRLRGRGQATGAFLVSRVRHPAAGLRGGEPGAHGRLEINGEAADTAGHYALSPGDEVLLETGGGGGFGKPQ
ncbi:MAG: hydantoinase B/oxoprolinase family protein [Pseudomonadota bacterium]